MSGEMTLKKWCCFFSDSTASSRGVMIGYLDNKKFSVNKICKESYGRVLIIEAEIVTWNIYLIKSL